MGALLAEWGLEILFGLISAIVLGYAKYKGNKLKKERDEARQLIEEKKKKEMEQSIETKLEPIYEELEELRRYIRETKDIEKSHMNLIIASYRFRLIQLCKGFLNQGYMTMDQRTQLDEFYTLYTGLGGNG
jgi:uncharacterized membrane protein